jgi:hypothetical protein
MEIPVVALAFLAVFAVGFVCAPLFRSEDELQPLYRSRPGVRQLYGPTEDDSADVEYGPLLEYGRTRCWHCGTVNESSYDYCGECLEPLA